MKAILMASGARRPVRSALRSTMVLGVASALLTTATVLLAASPASAAGPTVTAIAPVSGPIAGGTMVTITGTGFASPATVQFGAVAATSITVVNATTITAVSPAVAAPATVDVTVTVASVQSTPVVADQFTYVPTVTHISPSSGPIAGGTTVTITGTGFDSGSTVTFGTVPATSHTFVSSTQMTAVSPAVASPTTVHVTVTTSTSQTSAPTTADNFTYGPTVTSVSPAFGPTYGGTGVIITGTGFVAGATVAFGATPATSVNVVSATTITAVSPAVATPTVVDVTVSVAGGGTSATGTSDRFTYLPTVTNVSPNSGPVVGGTAVTINGTGFVAGSSVAFGTHPAAAVTIVSSTTISAISPAATAPGTVDVTVTAPGAGTSISSAGDHFTYVPSVSAVSPNSGPVAGGTTVTISGSGFIAGSSVAFGTHPAAAVTIVSNTTITAVSPAATAPGTVDVTVTAPGAGTSISSVGDHFTYELPALLAQAPLTLTSTTGTVGTPLALTSSGGSGTGVVTFAVTSTGTAGCVVSGNQLRAARAGTCSVTVSKAADATYLAASSAATTVSFSDRVVAVRLSASRVQGVVLVGRTSVVTIIGTGFYAKPTVKSNDPRTRAVVIHDRGKQLDVRVTALRGSATGWHLFTITLANGQRCTVRYLVK